METKLIDLKRPLVLATASEARRALVSATGLDFTASAVDIDESPLPGEAISEYVERLSRAKADAVLPPSLDALIVAVDTAIGLGDEIIGKPKDAAHARKILTKLSGQTHEVASAIALRDIMAASVSVEVTRTEVSFERLPEKTIEWYISTGEWKNRAGAYAIQGKGAALISRVQGCFTNVIGISIPTLVRMLLSV